MQKELENLAESVRSSLNLKYDYESVKFIEGFIERNKISIPKNEWDGLINSMGAFLGQCIIKNYGGKWEFDKESGTVAVAFDERNKAFPFSKTSKQFENGLVDSIATFYSVIPEVYNNVPRKKPWWKF